MYIYRNPRLHNIPVQSFGGSDLGYAVVKDQTGGGGINSAIGSIRVIRVIGISRVSRVLRVIRVGGYRLGHSGGESEGGLPSQITWCTTAPACKAP